MVAEIMSKRRFFSWCPIERGVAMRNAHAKYSQRQNMPCGSPCVRAMYVHVTGACAVSEMKSRPAAAASSMTYAGHCFILLPVKRRASLHYVGRWRLWRRLAGCQLPTPGRPVHGWVCGRRVAPSSVVRSVRLCLVRYSL